MTTRNIWPKPPTIYIKNSRNSSNISTTLQKSIAKLHGNRSKAAKKQKIHETTYTLARTSKIHNNNTINHSRFDSKYITHQSLPEPCFRPQTSKSHTHTHRLSQYLRQQSHSIRRSRGLNAARLCGAWHPGRRFAIF